MFIFSDDLLATTNDLLAALKDESWHKKGGSDRQWEVKLNNKTYEAALGTKVITKQWARLSFPVTDVTEASCQVKRVIAHLSH